MQTSDFIHRSPVASPHKGPVTRKTFPFDDVIMIKTSHLHNGIPSLVGLYPVLERPNWIDLVDCESNRGFDQETLFTGAIDFHSLVWS